MNSRSFLLIVTVSAILIIFIFKNLPQGATQTNMQITSSVFAQGQSIPAKYSCDGDNIHPPLSFSGVPQTAKSLALIMEDPDVPKGRLPNDTFDHWVVFNIPPQITGVAEGVTVAGTYGSNTSGKAAYTGPCPPDREHRYFFRLYAIDSILSLKSGATKNEVLAAMNGHIIATAELMGRYARPVR